MHRRLLHSITSACPYVLTPHDHVRSLSRFDKTEAHMKNQRSPATTPLQCSKTLQESLGHTIMQGAFFCLLVRQQHSGEV
eukprot:1151972-Pelagomonas_calceolata.AAC.2